MQELNKTSWSHEECMAMFVNMENPIDSEGFNTMEVTREGVTSTVRIHEEVAKQFMSFDPSSTTTEVVHLNGDKRNNSLDNLAIRSRLISSIDNSNSINK